MQICLILDMSACMLAYFMYIYDYNHTQIQMLDTKSKTIQHIKIEEMTLNNKINIIDFESNTLKHKKVF